MANTKSTAVSNQEAGTFLNPPMMIGSRQVSTIHVAVGALAKNETVEFLRLDSEARILSLKVMSDDLGDTLNLNFGVGQANDGAAPTAISGGEDCLADGVDLSSAIAVWTEILGFGTNGCPPEDMGKELWELATIPSNTYAGYQLVIYGTCSNSTTPAAGDIVLRIEWASVLGAS